MPTIRIPTPLRPFTGSAAEVAVEGETVGAALQNLTVKHPDLRKHLYTESGELRAFVNVFLAQEDVRHMQGEKTPLKSSDQLRIVPSVAGGQGAPAPAARVDHNALRVNQAFIISLLILAYLFNSAWLAACVALVLIAGAFLRRPGFKPAYDLFKQFGLLKPDVVADNPEPHLFSQGLGAVFVSGGALSLWVGAAGLGWGLCWLVVGLAALNLFGGFCAGCFVYYWLNRVNVPGFVKAPPPHTFPGMRPRSEG
jgi:molybdopterin converting factor small subunit